MIRMYIGVPAVPFVNDVGLAARIRDRFVHEAGQMVLDAIRSLLGTSSIYTLEPGYAAIKQRLAGFRREAGKDADQPLILSGEMFDNLTVVPDGNGFVVEVQDGAAMSPEGFDYTALWQERTDFMELGLDLVEDKLAEVLADIIADEMGL